MIKIENLTKRYGNLTAVDGLSCTIEQGKLYGLLGINGAGKTTTMNMLTGALAPTSGSITICGSDIAADPIAAKRHIGYLPEIPPLYPDLTVREYLNFVASAKKVEKTALTAHVSKVIDQTGLSAVGNRLIRNLSKGYCQRVGIAQALIGDPDILILDEPTVGLDPLQIVEIRELIRRLAKTHTVILSSHILTEVAELCDTILIISSGKLIAVDSLANLQKHYLLSDKLLLTVKCSPKKCEEVLKGISGVQKVEVKPNGSLTDVVIECAKGNDLREAVFFAFAAIRCPIMEMQLRVATLEDVFLSAATPAPTAVSELAKAQQPVGRREKQSPPQKSPNKERTDRPAPAPKSETPADDDQADDDYTPLFGRKEKHK